MTRVERAESLRNNFETEHFQRQSNSMQIFLGQIFVGETQISEVSDNLKLDNV